MAQALNAKSHLSGTVSFFQHMSVRNGGSRGLEARARSKSHGVVVCKANPLATDGAGQNLGPAKWWVVRILLV